MNIPYLIQENKQVKKNKKVKKINKLATKTGNNLVKNKNKQVFKYRNVKYLFRIYC